MNNSSFCGTVLVPFGAFVSSLLVFRPGRLGRFLKKADKWDSATLASNLMTD